MNSMMTMDRMMTMGMGNNNSMPMMGNQMMPTMMVPRCTMKMEKMANGMKVTCMCDDKVAAMMMQNLMTMNAGGMMGCCIMCNGQCVCCCNMTMGMCKCEMMEMGCMMMCTSGDAMAVKMMHACCDCMMAMMGMSGCSCYMMMNGMPMCCMMM